ncbi:hypothetical protein TIFTF001_043058 [Ficus carica]|uniref:Uncharacterized protein n=1 Tax=Ficus carica TaxID=3494 RepID=A0AA88CHM9_FICCA|nr:hypothetical protein TIFTF001_043058 [Ficus carica]
MAARHVVLAERKLTTYVYAVGCYRVSIRVGFLPSSFTIYLPVPQSLLYSMDPRRVDDDRDAAYTFYGIQPLVPLASRCLARDARLWWMTLGERAMTGDSWAEFRALIIAHYRPLPNEDADLPYRDPEIYNDMYLGRYLGYAADWHAYPNEEGLPSEIRILVPAPMAGMTVEHMINDIMEAEIIAHMLQVDALVDDIIQVPVDDAGIPEPLFEGGLFLPEDPIPVVPLQEILPQEVEADAEGNEVDPADFMATPEDQPEHPLVIIIDSDDDEEDVEE